jgi:lipopolysaccharide transport system ATP-binding protein
LQIISEIVGTEICPPNATEADMASMVSSDAEYAIEARDLHKTYTLYPSPSAQIADLLGLYSFWPWHKPVFPQHKALSGIDFKMKRGERVGFIGRNGAGKTTLLKLITQAAQPSKGSLTVRGEVQALMQVGLGFHPEFTGIENIRASLLYSGLDEIERQAAEDEIVSFCELGAYLQQPLKTYSLGMQARLQFACATAIKPEILIVDEILGAGDAYFAVKSSQRMERLTKSGCTLLLVSHSMQQIVQFCERCIWIDAGRIRQDGPVRSVIGEYEVHMSRLAANLPQSDPARTEGNFSARLTNAALPKQSDANSTTNGAEIATEPPPALSNAAAADGGRVTLGDGQIAHRWASEPGAKLDNLAIFVDNQPAQKFLEGKDVELRGGLRADLDGALGFVVSISLFTLAGQRVTRLTSPPFHVRVIAGELIPFTVHMSPCRLLAGHYYANVIVMPAEAMTGITQRRFDLVANFCDFEIFSIMRYSDDGLVTHPSSWSLPERYR